MKPALMNKPSADIIYTKDATYITHSQKVSEQAINLLKRTIYGTSGPKYQHTGQDKKAKHIAGPYFFNLYSEDKLAGTYCLSERLIKIPTGEINSFYGRYFAVDPSYSGKGYGSLLIKEAIRYVNRSTKYPYLTYVYVEETNERSLSAFRKDNYTDIGTLEALVFSRPYPKTDQRVSLLAENDRKNMRSLLEDTYKNHTLVQFDHLYYEGNYFVLKENNKVIAGVQANPVLWRIVDMPGIGGKFIMNVVPHLPVLKRLVNPDKYQFVSLEGIYVKPGRENELFSLLESVLVHFTLTSALIMLDVNSPVRELLKRSGKLGIMNALKKNIYSKVLLKTEGIDVQDVKEASNQPIYTSAFDYS
jgi:GNAT superfamily N-acetyltransferase